MSLRWRGIYESSLWQSQTGRVLVFLRALSCTLYILNTAHREILRPTFPSAMDWWLVQLASFQMTSGQSECSVAWGRTDWEESGGSKNNMNFDGNQVDLVRSRCSLMTIGLCLYNHVFLAQVWPTCSGTDSVRVCQLDIRCVGIFEPYLAKPIREITLSKHSIWISVYITSGSTVTKP